MDNSYNHETLITFFSKKPPNFHTLNQCSMCSSRLKTTYTVLQNILVIFHPKIIKYLQKIQDKVKNFPKGLHEFPISDCADLCKIKDLANNLIESFIEKDLSNFNLIKELSDIATSLLNHTFQFKIEGKLCCKLCSLKFTKEKLITHVRLCHGEFLALVYLLHGYSQSGISIYEETQKLINGEQIPNQVEKLPSESALETMSETKAHSESVINFKKRGSTTTSVTLSPPTKIIRYGVKDLKLDMLRKKQPKENIKHKEKTSTPATTVIRYGVEDLKREMLRKKQDKETIKKKENILCKMLSTHREKEREKEILFWQKKLTKYVTKHQQDFSELRDNLVNARTLLSDRKCLEDLIGKVSSTVVNRKIKDTSVSLLGKLFSAIEGNPKPITKLSYSQLVTRLNNKKHSSAEENESEDLNNSLISESSKSAEKSSDLSSLSESDNQEVIPEHSSLSKTARSEDLNDSSLLRTLEDSFLKGKHLGEIKKTYLTKKQCFASIFSTDSVSNILNSQTKGKPTNIRLLSAKLQLSKEKKLGTINLLSNPMLVTEDKQLVECYFCRKLNCPGLHPENFQL